MTIRKLDLSYIHKKDRELTLSLQNPVSGNPASMQFQPANVRLLLNNFPADSINPFFKGHTNFGFRQSLVSGYIQATTQDLVRDVLFDIELYLEDFGCKKKNLDVVYGNCKVTGHCELHDFFSTFSYKDASGLGLVNGAEAFVLKSNGDMSFTDDMPCQFHIEYVKATQDHFRTFMPGITDSILLEKLVSSGKIDISCLDEYDDIYLHWEQNINELKLFYPSDEDETPEILKGKMVIDYRIDDIRDNLDFKKCSLFLQTPDNQTVMDIVVDGRWAYQEKKEKTTCLITVNQLDAKMLHLAIKGSGEQKEGHKDNEKKAGQKKIKHWSWKKNKTYLWPIQENEPAPIDIGELETTLNFDIKNCTYDKLSAKATGRFHVDDNIFQADSIHSDSTQADSVQCGSVQGEINGGKFQLALFADLGKADGWILKGDIKLTNMKLDPFFQSLGSEATKKKNITGAINDLDLHIRTKGITLENLDKNLQASGSANVSGISFPFNDSDGVNVLHVLLFPTLALPRLIDTLPDIKMRKVLKDYMGNQLDVLSGYKNIVLEKGEIQFHSATESRKTDQIVDKANFQGSDLNVTTEKATINPFYNEIDMRTKTVFGTIRYPMHATGVLTNPNFHRQHFVVDFVNENLLQSIWNKQKKEDPPPDDDGTGSEDDKTKEKPAQKP